MIIENCKFYKPDQSNKTHSLGPNSGPFWKLHELTETKAQYIEALKYNFKQLTNISSLLKNRLALSAFSRSVFYYQTVKH